MTHVFFFKSKHFQGTLLASKTLYFILLYYIGVSHLLKMTLFLSIPQEQQRRHIIPYIIFPFLMWQKIFHNLCSFNTLTFDICPYK